MNSFVLRGLGLIIVLPSLMNNWLVNSLGFPIWAKWIFFGVGLSLYLTGAFMSISERKKQKNDQDSELK